MALCQGQRRWSPPASGESRWWSATTWSFPNGCACRRCPAHNCSAHRWTGRRHRVPRASGRARLGEW